MLKFGMFTAPHHIVAQNPTLQIEEDLRLAEYLDMLGFDEVWFGEHHSGGSEIIASPEMMIAAAAQRTQTIRLGAGVNSLPYHHPFILADRWVMLSHLTKGRAMFGAGPGALPSDALQMGLDVLEGRKQMEAALEAIVGLLDGDQPVTMDTDWFRLEDARLHMRPYKNTYDLRVAAMTSPSGPRAAGRFGTGMLSVAATVPAGYEALRNAWAIAEERAQEFGTTVDRARWAVVAPVHLAESLERARKDVEHGMTEWLDHYKKFVPGSIWAEALDIPGAIDELGREKGTVVIGTPDMTIAQIERLLEQTGGFGCFLIQAHDWADPEATRRSYDLFARHVIPHFDGQIEARLSNKSWVEAMAPRLKAEFAAGQDRARAEHEAANAATGSTSSRAQA